MGVDRLRGRGTGRTRGSAQDHSGTGEARCELAQDAQRIIMENALMLPTLSEPIFYAVSDEVRDFELMSEGQFYFVHNAWLGRE